MKTNKKFKEACPPLTEDEFKKLEYNILHDGTILSPILTWNDFIIDGHNRYEISQKHGIHFDTKEMEFESERAAIIWIKEHQLGTRNLTDAQAWQLVKDIGELLKERGKEKRKRKPTDSVLSTVDETKHDTRKELADKLDWSEGKVATAQYVDKHADEELKEEVYSGKKTFNKAYEELKGHDDMFTEDFQAVSKFIKRIKKIVSDCEKYEYMKLIQSRLQKTISEMEKIKDGFVND